MMCNCQAGGKMNEKCIMKAKGEVERGREGERERDWLPQEEDL